MSKIQGQLNFGLFCILLLLYTFSDSIVADSFSLIMGRTHPLWLHLPIGLIAGVVMAYFSLNMPRSNAIVQMLLNWTATSALLTAIAGMLLAAEPEAYEQASIQWHKHAGTAFAILCYILSSLYPRLEGRIFHSLLVITVITMVITGHLGGVITHGEQFLFPDQTQKAHNIPKKAGLTGVYEAAVLPILQSKCTGCHNEKKTKGNLNMSDTLSFLKGGKNGSPIIWGKPEESLLLQRLHLPADDEYHMPPKERAQLNSTEIDILSAWINECSGFAFTSSAIPKESILQKLISQGNQNSRKYDFPSADPKIIQSLNTAYRNVRPEYTGSPALSVSYFLASYFTSGRLEEILQVRSQITILNLAGMPVTDKDLDIVAKCQELTKLQLNGTKISSKGIIKLKSLTKLESLSISGTSCNKLSEELWKSLPQLHVVYAGETGISQKDIDQWKKMFPKIKFETNVIGADEIKLSAPILVNEKAVIEAGENVELKHHIKGTRIYYTTDGSVPDTSRSAVYDKPFKIQGSCDIRAVAIKSGWLPSDTARFSVFEKGLPPVSCQLISSPSTQYQGLLEKTFTNGELAPAANLRDQNWIAYRENPFTGLFTYKKSTPVRKISLSYALQIPQYVFPPVSVKILAGNDPQNLKVIGFKKLPVTGPHIKDQVSSQVVHIELKPEPFKYYRIEALNLPTIPDWHPGKGEKGWLFIDEIFFYAE